jgi:FdhE protein
MDRVEFSRDVRLRRIADLLPRFPEAEELLVRYREHLMRPAAAAPGTRSGSMEPVSDSPRSSGHDGAGDPTRAVPVPARCRSCGGPPGLSVLIEEAGTHGSARRLLCSRCERSWSFPRIICPLCGEEEAEKLPRLQAEEIPAARIEACDSCGTYLKSIDLTRDGRAVPAVDDLATCALDLAAHDRGYRRADEVGDLPGPPRPVDAHHPRDDAVEFP